MSLRDWFAGQALAGMMGDSERNGTIEKYAAWAYLAADAMLTARHTSLLAARIAEQKEKETAHDSAALA